MVSNIVHFHPYLGKIPILTNIFQMGWNHQPENQWDQQLMDQLSQLQKKKPCKPSIFEPTRFASVLGPAEISFWAQVNPKHKSNHGKRTMTTTTKVNPNQPNNHWPNQPQRNKQKTDISQQLRGVYAILTKFLGGGFKCVFYFYPYLGFHDPIWLICFKWVGSTTNCRFGWLRYGFCVQCPV